MIQFDISYVISIVGTRDSSHFIIRRLNFQEQYYSDIKIKIKILKNMN